MEIGWLGSVREIPEAGEETGTCSDPQGRGLTVRKRNRSAQRMLKGPDLTAALTEDGVFAQEGLEGQQD